MPTRQDGVENRETAWEGLFAKSISLLSRSLESRDLSAFTRLQKDHRLPVGKLTRCFFSSQTQELKKLQRGLVNSKIINSISLPKLQEFCNENAATWRPSLLQSRYSYIIKRLVKTLNQPMTATVIRTTRSSKIYQRNWTDFCKGRNFRLGSHEGMLLLV